jgi:hypothetical protein
MASAAMRIWLGMETEQGTCDRISAQAEVFTETEQRAIKLTNQVATKTSVADIGNGHHALRFLGSQGGSGGTGSAFYCRVHICGGLGSFRNQQDEPFGERSWRRQSGKMGKMGQLKVGMGVDQARQENRLGMVNHSNPWIAAGHRSKCADSKNLAVAND